MQAFLPISRATAMNRKISAVVRNALRPMTTSAGDNKKKTSIMLELHDKSGALQNVLGYFHKNDVNMTWIESRPSKGTSRNYSFFIAFDGRQGDPNVDSLFQDLQANCLDLSIIDAKKVPWFPRTIQELDYSASNVLDAGTDLESDHPGFHDEVYRTRRNHFATIARTFRQGDEIPRVDYTDKEIETWGAVYNRMEDLWQKHACVEFNEIIPLLETNCGYASDNIPQQQDISKFLQETTGFTLRPVAGLLSSRDFLNGLAFRVFFSTAYIRHHSMPLYTPEPDICHELLGHAPMFADPDFADFSHEIGLASLGASDDEIERLATCYWFSVEFGVVKQKEELKAYGAGLLSSFGELEYACDPEYDGEKPEYRPWNPYQACRQAYPITTYQPIYYVATSLPNAREQMHDFCENLSKPFHARYDPTHQTVVLDREVIRNETMGKTT